MISLFGENSLPSLDCTAFFVYLCHVVVFSLYILFISASRNYFHIDVSPVRILKARLETKIGYSGVNCKNVLRKAVCYKLIKHS